MKIDRRTLKPGDYVLAQKWYWPEPCWMLIEARDGCWLHVFGEIGVSSIHTSQVISNCQLGAQCFMVDHEDDDWAGEIKRKLVRECA